VSDDLWAVIEPLLPPEPPKPKGGRSRLSNRAALTGIVKAGTKHHLLVERTGLPLAVLVSAANVNDGQMLQAILDAIPPIRGRRGRPRKRPKKLHADKGYDYPTYRRAGRRRRITPRIARKGIESSQHLGRSRWVVERTLAWLSRFRRLKVRYERRADTHQAFLSLGCSLICCQALQKEFC
jgi:transposase